ncbi:BTAD domain-containing putative transcriptional regulator [Streptomyces sp. NBC_00439]|uniref:AfsR/SARP family transcriptional regulator n=1 Tax=Streptomyces sp. NBC_00439 TaxID=2903650 RepID=UPI0022553529|nr:BTAD domain-containing putative transcriptional regulator [Streptomyces sp. NBC_00439]MCX5106424.1 tetratricopeptide repeat protein [Streptomyces sp. NBC_00439]
MRFRILGPLEVFDGTHWRGISAAKPRTLLATLLVQRDVPVPTGRLGAELWGEREPKAAANLIQQYVMRLRRELGDRQGRLLVTRPPGYQMVLADEDDLDAAAFARLGDSGRVALAAGDAERAAGLLAEALALWRGPALVDVPTGPMVEAEAARLAEQRLDVLQARVEADLACGRHAALVPELRQSVREHPLREGLWGQLMLALYRSGRQAEALDAYREVHRLLADELSIEPSAPLCDLQLRMLRGDPRLGLPATEAEAEAEAEGQDQGEREGEAEGEGDARARSKSRRRPRPESRPSVGASRAGQPSAAPRQLPAAVAGFAGRRAELRLLDQLPADASAGPGPAVCVIAGTAGAGKTSLALHWAHRAAPHFPDGQLYVNLHGFAPATGPMSPGEAIRGFLEALSVPPERIPDAPEARAALLRTETAGRRLLFVLDNAADAAQVRPLLPGSAGCAVVVTSRGQLTGLAVTDGAVLLSLDVLPREEARELLAARLGADRVAAEPEPVTELIDLCARLPLALAVTAARAVGRPGFALSAVVAELRDVRGRLEALDAGEGVSSVRTVFSWSYRRLDTATARMFRLLGLHPGRDVAAPAVAALAGLSVREAAAALTALARVHLIAEHRPGRYSFHDLLRAYATGLTATEDTEAARTAALHRLLDHCLHSARAARRHLAPARGEVPLPPPVTGSVPHDPEGYEEAMAWFEAEHAVLLAVADAAGPAGFDGHAWQLPLAMADFLHLSGRWHDWVSTQRTAIVAARQQGDRAGTALCHCESGRAAIRMRRYEEAHRELLRALELQRGLGDLTAQADTLRTLAWSYEQQGDYRAALQRVEQVLELQRAVGNLAGQAGALNNIGWCHTHLGDHEEALTRCREALRLHLDGGSPLGAAYTWETLGFIHHSMGQYAEAVDSYRQCRDGFRRFGNRYGEADALHHLGGSLRMTGDQEAARDAWHAALAILDELEHPDADVVRELLLTTAG